MAEPEVRGEASTTDGATEKPERQSATAESTEPGSTTNDESETGTTAGSGDAELVIELGEIDIEEENRGVRARPVRDLYVPAVIQGETVMLLVDTGATVTILKPEHYRIIPKERRPPLVKEGVVLRQADGKEVACLGKAVLDVKIGGCCQTLNVAVADVSHGTLGMDFLVKTGAVVDFGRLEMRIGETIVPCRTAENGPFFPRVVSACDVQIPPRHEMIVDAMITANIRRGRVGLVEPVKGGPLAENGVLVSKTLVDISSGAFPVKVINLGLQPRYLRAGTMLGKLSVIEVGDVEELRFVAQEPRPIMEVPEQARSSREVPEHLTDLVNQSAKDLGPEDTERVTNLLIDYQDVFSKGEYDIGRTNFVKHSIDTENARPIRQPLRRSSPQQREEVERQVGELLDKGMIQPSDSPWSSPVVLVNKKDGTKRLCIDYRKLNDVTIKDAYPLPRIDDSLDALSGAMYFSTLDLASGYWQVGMNADARDKSAFSTPSGLYSWNVLPFGLCNAPSTFERLMECVLAGLRWEILLVYLDDVIVFGRTIAESVDRLRAVLDRFRAAGLKLKPSKCHLFQRQVAYLGHVVSPEGIHTDPAKIEAVRDWPTPITQTQVRSFLGLASYYRRFIRGFAEIAGPLHRLTEKSAKFKWTS